MYYQKLRNKISHSIFTNGNNLLNNFTYAAVMTPGTPYVKTNLYVHQQQRKQTHKSNT